MGGEGEGGRVLLGGGKLGEGKGSLSIGRVLLPVGVNGRRGGAWRGYGGLGTCRSALALEGHWGGYRE